MVGGSPHGVYTRFKSSCNSPYARSFSRASSVVCSVIHILLVVESAITLQIRSSHFIFMAHLRPLSHMDQPPQRLQHLTASFLHHALHEARPFCIPGCPHVSCRVLPSRALPSKYCSLPRQVPVTRSWAPGVVRKAQYRSAKKRINLMIDCRTTALHVFIAVRRVLRTGFLFPPRRHVQLKK